MRFYKTLSDFQPREFLMEILWIIVVSTLKKTA